MSLAPEFCLLRIHRAFLLYRYDIIRCCTLYRFDPRTEIVFDTSYRGLEIRERELSIGTAVTGNNQFHTPAYQFIDPGVLEVTTITQLQEGAVFVEPESAYTQGVTERVRNSTSLKY